MVFLISSNSLKAERKRKRLKETEKKSFFFLNDSIHPSKKQKESHPLDEFNSNT